MMENENSKKTKWNKEMLKKRTFSDTSIKSNIAEDNFQTTNMIYKINNIKNKKNKIENYKNIELLENIHEVQEVENTKNIKEGYVTVTDPDFIGLPDSYFDGIDTPDKKNNDDPRTRVIMFINKIFKSIDNFNYTKARFIVEALSHSTSQEKKILNYIGFNTEKFENYEDDDDNDDDDDNFENYDDNDNDNDDTIIEGNRNKKRRRRKKNKKLKQKQLLTSTAKETVKRPLTVEEKKEQKLHNNTLIVKKYIAWFESILISYFACYNWAFLMYYRYGKEDGEEYAGRRVKTAKIDTYFIQNASFDRFDAWAMVYKFINFFFIYALMFVEYIQNALLDKIPPKLNYIFNLKGCFIVIFFVLVYFINYCSGGLYNFFIAILKGSMKNMYVNLMYLVLILAYFFGTYNWGYITKTPGYTLHSIADFSMGLPFTSPIIALLRFIVIMLISVPIGGFLCVCFLLYHSFFGIFVNTPIDKYAEIFSTISEFINDNNDPNFEKEKTAELSLFEKIRKAYNTILDFMYKYIVFITFIVMLIYAIIDYSKNINSNILKLHLIIISVILICMMTTMSLLTFFSTITKTQIVHPVTPVEDEPPSFFDLLFKPVFNLVKMIIDKTVTPFMNKIQPTVEKVGNSVSNVADGVGEVVNEAGKFAKNVNKLADNAVHKLEQR